MDRIADSFGGIAGQETAPPATIIATLSGYGLIRFGGDDARQFLHGQLSCDVDNLGVDCAQYGSYNTPQGRMLASFLLWRDESGYLMQLPRAMCASIAKRLSMYVLRSKVTIADASDAHVLLGIRGARAEAAVKSAFEAVPATALTIAKDRNASLLRLGADRFEVAAAPGRASGLQDALSSEATPVSQATWDWTDIRAGVPYITPATQDQFVPQMTNLDLIGGVSFSKGCYPGQEIVARMHYLGRLKQRMYLANIAGADAPQPGDKLYSADTGGQASGMIVNAAPSPEGGHDVLAVIQIESARAGDVHWKLPGGPPLKFLELPYKT